MNPFSILLAGLFTGGLTCLAVQGGLLASAVALRTESEDKETALKGQVIPVLTFLTTRLLAYTLLGIVLGSLGSVVQLSLSFRVAMQSVIALFMIGTALNLLNVHPLFRFFSFQPPRALSRIIKNQSKNKEMFAPAILGFLTVLIPCGATQAMMAYAVSTASPFDGGLTMFLFILGTSPLFFILGVAAKKLTGTTSLVFHKVAATLILLIALYNLNGAIALSGSPYTFQKILTSVQCTVSFCEEGDALGSSDVPVRDATIYFTRKGYTTKPRTILVQSGETITLTLTNQTGGGCIQSFTIPKLGVQKIVRVGTTEKISFIAPEKGSLPFMCSMGMYAGEILVI